MSIDAREDARAREFRFPRKRDREWCRCEPASVPIIEAGADTPTSLIMVSGEHRAICEWRQVVLPLDPAVVDPFEESAYGLAGRACRT